MPHELQINKELKVIQLTYSGEVGVDERQQAREGVFQAVEETGFVRVLVDMRNSDIRMSEKDVIRFATSFERVKNLDGYRLACIIGPHNQTESLMETIINLEGINVKYFMSYDSGMRWLIAI